MRFVSRSCDDTERFAEKFAASLSGGEVIAMFGGMGSGKTAFTRGLCRGLSFSGEVSSPTFAVVHVYSGGRLEVYHFDMYRISGWDDLYSTGFFDYMDMGGVEVVEWSENITAALPDDCIKISISRGNDDDERIFDIEGK